MEKDETTIVMKHGLAKGYQRITFNGAFGKTIQSIQHNRDDKEGVWTLSIGFTDGSMFVFDIDSRPRVRVNYMADDGGDLRSLSPRKTVCDW